MSDDTVSGNTAIWMWAIWYLNAALCFQFPEYSRRKINNVMDSKIVLSLFTRHWAVFLLRSSSKWRLRTKSTFLDGERDGGGQGQPIWATVPWPSNPQTAMGTCTFLKLSFQAPCLKRPFSNRYITYRGKSQTMYIKANTAIRKTKIFRLQLGPRCGLGQGTDPVSSQGHHWDLLHG